MVKEKPNSTRIYDDEGFRKRAACLCVKNESESEILLVSSSRNKDQWIVPGGGVEPEESTSVAAMREVIEEAGVMGKIDRCLGVFENNERRHRTAVYVLVVTEELPEWEDARDIGRKRKWFPIDEAVELLAANKPVHLTYVQHLRQQQKGDTSTIVVTDNSSTATTVANGTTSDPSEGSGGSKAPTT